MYDLSLEKFRPDAFFKSYLSTRSATIFCLLIALVNKSLVAWIFTGLVGDKSLYLLFAKQIFEGHHPLEPLGLFNGQQNYIYNGGITSPMYMILAMPFLWLTKSYYATSIILDVISWFILLTGLYRFSSIALKGKWMANLLVLCAGFFIYPHELGSGPKDTFSIGCMLWIAFLITRFSDEPNFYKSLLLSFFIILLGLMKFLYSPLVLVFLLLIWIVAYKAKTRNHIRNAAVVSLICTIVFVGFYFYLQYLQQLSKSANLQPPVPELLVQKGLYPKNLTRTYPFVSSAVVNVNFWSVQISDIFKWPYSKAHRIFQFIDLFLLLPVCVFIAQIMRRQKARVIWQTGMAVSATILFMLAYMGLTNKVVYQPGVNNWTYVEEARSYLFIIIFLQVVLFYLIFKSTVSPAFKNFLFLLFLIECVHGFYFTTKQVINKPSYSQTRNNGAVEKTVSFLQSANASASFAYLSTPNPHLRYYALLHHIPVVSFSNDGCKTLQNAREQPLIVALYTNSRFNTEGCLPGKVLVTTDSIPPFVLKLYLTQNHSQ